MCEVFLPIVCQKLRGAVQKMGLTTLSESQHNATEIPQKLLGKTLLVISRQESNMFLPSLHTFQLCGRFPFLVP